MLVSILVYEYTLNRVKYTASILKIYDLKYQ